MQQAEVVLVQARCGSKGHDVGSVATELVFECAPAGSDETTGVSGGLEGAGYVECAEALRLPTL